MSAGSCWVPVLTSEAGLCLTSENWQEAQSNTACYYLDALLLKPGLSTLKAAPDLASYVNWSGTIILNASRFKANHEGVITLVSPYDGSKIKLNYAQLIDLINHLKPSIALLPPNILKEFPQVWENWNSAIMPYVAANHLAEGKLPLSYGVYFTVNEFSPKIKEELAQHLNVSKCVQGSLNLESIQGLSELGIPYIESDEPANLGVNGLVYSPDGVIDLKEEQHALQFTSIDSECECSTCALQLTKAYLHHLFMHTPLLCQRFLIQHNGHYVQNSLRK